MASQLMLAKIDGLEAKIEFGVQ
ncbi:uncharacterized protein G2W53_003974 [Senna tora]|uniref:Uncharacterized protein n=1 Tax=Senna tora TaxID=362788 RepID=A0A835CG81_9FABA|nr:uncharacterized protein G2W53_003974 [Senna tora]